MKNGPLMSVPAQRHSLYSHRHTHMLNVEASRAQRAHTHTVKHLSAGLSDAQLAQQSVGSLVEAQRELLPRASRQCNASGSEAPELLPAASAEGRQL
jgi:hypothetical protein